MQVIKLLLIAGAVTAFAAACATQPTTTVVTNSTINANRSATNANAASPDELAAARATYLQVCASCHKEDGAGGRREFDGGTIRVPDFRSERHKQDPDSEYIEQIEKGGDGMPAFKGRLSDEQIRDLVRYIRRDLQGISAK